MPTRGRAAASSTSIGSRFRFCVPMMTSTALERCEDLRPFLLRDAAGDGDDRTVALFDGHLADLAQPREELLLGASRARCRC